MPAETIEAPVQAQQENQHVAETSIGDVFNAALKQARGNTQQDDDTPVVDKSAAKPPKPAAAKEQAEPAKPVAPKSALDAALSDGEAAPIIPEKKDGDWKPDAPTDEIFKGDKNWKAARTGMEQRDKRIGELQTQIAELQPRLESAGKPTPEITAELEQLRQTVKERDAKLAEYNDALTALNIDLHPDFRREFIDGRNELVQSAGAKLKSYGGDPNKLAEALTIPEGIRRDEAIEAALSELSDSARAKILRTVTDVEALDEKAAKLRTNPQQGYEQLERKHAAARQQQAEEGERTKQAEFERISRDLVKQVPTLRNVDPTVEGGKEWNESATAARENGFKLFSPDTPFPKLVAAAVKGEHYDFIVPLLTTELTGARKEIGELKAQLAQFDESQPNFNGRKPAKKSAAEADLEKTPGQRYRETLAKLSGGDDD